ncbi:hypothetical protein CAEBREN_09958 [Caenorhabditis brenneri]|uniref:Serpentine Receptor, class H n=1 Tax=Caenorhabditis brenneri TaxID=135651 RepID=G0MU50_CAEBE|nr:hypothetical protein CAEBREN_09958 [Caenorhabditis brenneri]
MNITCIPSYNYFDTPEFLTIALHINSFLSTPVYIFGIYVVLTKTPEQMKNVRWYLINSHIWIILFDYTLSIMVMPILLLPAFGGYTLGILQLIGVSAFAQVLLYLIMFGCMASSLVLVFENRFSIICATQIHFYWTKIRWISIFCHFAYVFLGTIPLFSIFPDQKIAVPRMFSSLPCLPHYVYDAPVCVLAETYVYYLVIINVFMTICTLEVIFMVSFMSYTIVQQLKGHRLSRKTYEMQKNFISALLLQVSIPLMTIVLPMVPWLYFVLKSLHMQWVVNIGVVFMASHGCLATIVMMIAHRPYRDAIIFMIRKKTIVSVDNSIMVMIIIGFWYCLWITNLGVIMFATHGAVATISMLIAHRPYREASLTMIRKRCAASVKNRRRAMDRNALSNVQI